MVEPSLSLALALSLTLSPALAAHDPRLHPNQRGVSRSRGPNTTLNTNPSPNQLINGITFIGEGVMVGTHSYSYPYPYPYP